MADSEVELKLKATGGDQVAAEAQKAEDGIEDLTDGVEDLKKELGPVEKAADDAGKSLGKMGGDADDAAGKLDTLVNLQRAEVANKIAGGLATIGAKVKEAAEDFAESDPEFSKTLQGISDGIDSASGAMSGAAQGFAVGGPFGAAIGALVGGLMPQVKQAFDDMTESIKGASEAEARAVEMKEKLKTAQENFAAAVLSDEIKDQYEAQTEALKNLLSELDSARKGTAAEDKVASARRDNADAEAIRNGANPEDVKAQRAKDDAARAKARIDYEVDNEKKVMLEKQKIADEAARGLDGLKADGGATGKQVEEAEAILKKAQEAADAAARSYADKTALAPLEKEAIDTKAAGRVDGLAADKEKRLAREEADRVRKEEQQQASAQRQAEAAAKKAEREALLASQSGAETRLAGTAAGNQAKITGSSNRSSALQGLAKDIGSADTEAEIAAVREQIAAKQGELGAVIVAALTDMLNAQAKLVAQVATIQQKIRNL